MQIHSIPVRRTNGQFFRTMFSAKDETIGWEDGAAIELPLVPDENIIDVLPGRVSGRPGQPDPNEIDPFDEATLYEGYAPGKVQSVFNAAVYTLKAMTTAPRLPYGYDPRHMLRARL